MKHFLCHYCLSPDSNAVGDPVSTLYKYSSNVEKELTVVKISPYLTSLAGMNLNFDNFCETKKKEIQVIGHFLAYTDEVDKFNGLHKAC